MCNRGIHRCLITDIGAGKEGSLAERSDSRLALGLADVEDGHLAAGLHDSRADGESEAGGAAADDRVNFVQLHRISPSKFANGCSPEPQGS